MRQARRPKVTAWDVRRLKRLQRRCTDVRVLRRSTVILMLAAGSRVKDVCEATGYTRNAIEKIRTRWDRGKFQSLKDRPRPGRPPKAGPAYRRALVQTVQTLPLQHGYAFTVWTTARLAEHLFQKTGVRLCAERVAQILKEEGFTYGVPAHTLKGKRSERDHARTKKRLHRLKKGRCRPVRDIGFVSPTSAASTSCRT